MSKRGFTLIELLLVTGIISILMSVIFFRVTEAKKRAEDTSMMAESGQVSRAVYQYKEDHNGFVPGHTTGQSGRRTILEKNTGDTDTNLEYTQALQPLVEGGYISDIPYSPSGFDYAYIISEDGQSAVFVAGLNNSKSNRSSSQKNSCELTYNPSFGSSSPAIYPDAVPGSYLEYNFSGGCFIVSPEDVSTVCPHTGQINNHTSCFAVVGLNSPCECGYNGIILPPEYQSTFPLGICSLTMKVTREDPNGTAPVTCTFRETLPPPPATNYFLCEHDEVYPVVPEVPAPEPSDGLCSGAFETDYCSCL